MFPYNITDLDECTNKKLLSDFDGERTGFCQVGPNNWLLPAAYKDHAEQYYNMPIKNDDVWLITFPRSGTTLCQEMVWLLNNNLDYSKAAEIPLYSRFPFYEFAILFHEKFLEDLANINNNDPKVLKQLSFWKKHGYDYIPDLPTPRHIKTHLPFSLLPQNLTEKCKVIYVARNPKDVAVSYFHHNSLLKVHGYMGDFTKYWDYFQNDLLVYSPYWDHIKEGWERRDHPNVLFVFYEDLIKDMHSSIKKIATFLNKPIAMDGIDRLAKHLHIDNFRKVVKIQEEVVVEGALNNSAQGFIRKGTVGGNKEFTEDLLKKADAWIKKNLMRTDLVFPINGF